MKLWIVLLQLLLIVIGNFIDWVGFIRHLQFFIQHNYGTVTYFSQKELPWNLARRSCARCSYAILCRKNVWNKDCIQEDSFNINFGGRLWLLLVAIAVACGYINLFYFPLLSLRLSGLDSQKRPDKARLVPSIVVNTVKLKQWMSSLGYLK